jgi:hypothetical protein
MGSSACTADLTGEQEVGVTASWVASLVDPRERVAWNLGLKVLKKTPLEGLFKI